jgi:alcohol dehydrogenase (NADP+)
MEKLIQTGKVKAIGISNFSRKQLEQLLASAKVKPAVHQLETHPYLQQQVFIDWHKELGIHVTAYSPFGNSNDIYQGHSKIPKLMDHPVIVKIAGKHNCPASDIILAWNLHRGVSVIPKTIHVERMRDNMLAVKVRLDEADLEQLQGINGPYRFNNCSRSWGFPYFDDLEDGGYENAK